MTKEEAESKGYKIVQASSCEIGLIKQGKGVRTWFYSAFNPDEPITIEHPLIQRAIEIQEDFEAHGIH